LFQFFRFLQEECKTAKKPNELSLRTVNNIFSVNYVLRNANSFFTKYKVKLTVYFCKMPLDFDRQNMRDLFTLEFDSWKAEIRIVLETEQTPIVFMEENRSDTQLGDFPH